MHDFLRLRGAERRGVSRSAFPSRCHVSVHDRSKATGFVSTARIFRLAVDPIRSSRSGSRPLVKPRQALSAAPGMSCYRHRAAFAGKVAYGCTSANRSHPLEVKPLFADFVRHSHTGMVVRRRPVEALAGIARMVKH